jgi:hypothetical protein
MKKIKWLFLSNVFRILAKKSMKRFYKFCYLFMQGLKSNTTDPFFSTKYQEMLPFYTTFKTTYDLKFGTKGQRKGDTKYQKKMFKQLIVKMHAWDIAIQVVYLNDTSEYTKIFPYGLSPFSQYPMEMRITYLRNAVNQLSGYIELHAVYVEMNQFLLDLQGARDEQTTKSTGVTESIADLLSIALDFADEIYGVLGDFMKKFRKTPEKILPFFPVFLLKYRTKNSAPDPDLHELTIEKASIIEAGFNFGHNDSLNLYDTGETGIFVWFTADQTLPRPKNALSFAPQDIRTIIVSDYAGQDDRYMMIENISTETTGTFEITVN